MSAVDYSVFYLSYPEGFPLTDFSEAPTKADESALEENCGCPDGSCLFDEPSVEDTSVSAADYARDAAFDALTEIVAGEAEAEVEVVIEAARLILQYTWDNCLCS